MSNEYEPRHARASTPENDRPPAVSVARTNGEEASEASAPGARQDAGAQPSSPDSAKATSAGQEAHHAFGQDEEKVAWGALWAVVIGFFMILVDATIVSTAMPAIMGHFDTSINNVVWVTSAYLLAYAVPLLITGRLGDRFGPRNVYLVGLVVFTLSSLWCGLASSIGSLIVARVFQGLGAAIMTPQTMSIITRLFPPQKRGAAMGIWGAVAGVASLVGPILGGVLVDSLGWEWIFFVNVPVGAVAFWRAWTKVPKVPTTVHKFDVLGILLSAAGMFLVVFGIQEGHGHDWGKIWGEVTVPELIVGGIVLLGLFVLWQRFTKSEPLVPLGLFRDRNFSLGNAAILLVGLMIASFALPYMLYLQEVRGFSPTQAALMLAPMAVISGVMALFVGRALTPRSIPYIATFGLAMNAGGLFLLGALLTPDRSIWLLMIPAVMMGVGGSCMWAPISVATTRDLPRTAAGAGSGVYNTTRQIGSVLGSSLMAMMMENRLAEKLPKAPAGHGGGSAPAGEGAMGGSLPQFLHEGYATAMGQSLWLAAAAVLVGMVLVFFFRRTPVREQKNSR